jgi:molecular chaperone DnaK
VDRNTFLGKFEFTRISPNPDGGPREVLVSFDYDVDGIVHVTARDRRSGRQADIKITGLKDRLTEEEKARASAILETFPHAESDAVAALRKRAESLLARLRTDGKREAASELECLLVDLDNASDTDATGAIVDRLVDWLYEHEDE